MIKGLPVKVQDMLRQFTEKAQNIYCNDLVSITVYGSAASGEFNPKRSTINIAIVLKDAGLKEIAKLSAMLRSHKFRLIEPVFFTEEYIKQSLDVFPLEFLDIQENHIVLVGRDVFKDLTVDTRNLRFQCEQELKSKLILVRKAYARSGDASDLQELLFKTFTSSLHIMRNLVRLKGKAPSYEKQKILDDMRELFGIETEVFERILSLKKSKSRLQRKDIEMFLTDFTASLENVITVVDRL